MGRLLSIDGMKFRDGKRSDKVTVDTARDMQVQAVCLGNKTIKSRPPFGFLSMFADSFGRLGEIIDGAKSVEEKRGKRLGLSRRKRKEGKGKGMSKSSGSLSYSKWKDKRRRRGRGRGRGSRWSTKAADPQRSGMFDDVERDVDVDNGAASPGASNWGLWVSLAIQLLRVVCRQGTQAC